MVASSPRPPETTNGDEVDSTAKGGNTPALEGVPSAKEGSTAAKERNPSSPALPTSPGAVTGTPPAATDSIGNLQQTVSLLIAERADLQAQISSLKGASISARRDSQLLDEGRGLITRLEGEKAALEARLTEAEERVGAAKGLQVELEKAEKEAREVKRERDEMVRAREGVEAGMREREEKEGEKMRELERARERESGLEAEVGRLRLVSLLAEG